eukprot:3636549-Prymnesium_polylepis.1
MNSGRTKSRVDRKATPLEDEVPNYSCRVFVLERVSSGCDKSQAIVARVSCHVPLLCRNATKPDKNIYDAPPPVS